MSEGPPPRLNPRLVGPAGDPLGPRYVPPPRRPGAQQSTVSIPPQRPAQRPASASKAKEPKQSRLYKETRAPIVGHISEQDVINSDQHLALQHARYMRQMQEEHRKAAMDAANARLVERQNAMRQSLRQKHLAQRTAALPGTAFFDAGGHN